MVDNFLGKELIDFSPGASGAAVAFVIVGALSFIIIQVYTAMTVADVAGIPSNANGATTPAVSSAELRPVRASELSVANGEDGCPIYIAVADPFSSQVTVFDMALGRDFYGPGGPYHVFAGRNATYGLAKSSVDPKDVEGDITTLTATERDTHAQWYAKYDSKYAKVGYLVGDGEADMGGSTSPGESKKDA